MGKIVDGLLAEVKALNAAQKKTFAQQIGGVLGIKGLGTSIEASPLGGITDTSDILGERLRARTEAFKNQGIAAKDLIESFGKIEEASIALTGKTEAGIAAFNALAASMKSFAFVSSDTREDIVKSAMTLEQFGVSAGTVGEIMDTAVLSFGLSGDELSKITNKLGNIVASFPGQASQIAENFRNAQQSLLYDSNKIMEVFGKLQKTSTMTGVSFESLTREFGKSMDTFQGSSEKAGRLNAILGKSVFNSIDLLGKTEAERVETIIAGVKKNVNVEALKQNKFQLQAVAAGLGLTPDETRRLLSGKATVEDVMKGKEDPRAKAQRLMQEALDNNTMSLDQLQKTYLAIAKTDFEKAILGMNVQTQKRMTQEVKKLLGITGDTNITTLAGLAEAAISTAARVGTSDDTLKGLKKTIDTVFTGIGSGKLDVSSVAVKTFLEDLGNDLRGEITMTQTQRIEDDLARIQNNQEMQAIATGTKVGDFIMENTVAPVFELIRKTFPKLGEKDPISAKTLEKMSGIEVEAKKQTEATNALVQAFAGGVKIVLDKDPATGGPSLTGKLELRPEFQTLLKKTMEAKRRE